MKSAIVAEQKKIPNRAERYRVLCFLSHRHGPAVA